MIERSFNDVEMKIPWSLSDGFIMTNQWSMDGSMKIHDGWGMILWRFTDYYYYGWMRIHDG